MKDMLLQAMDERQFGLFVAAAKGFRSGSIDEAAFLKACASSFGKRMPHIFPEFVTLLPDIPKQRQLYFVAKDAERSPRKSVPTGISTLAECSTCGQIVLGYEYKQHEVICSPVAPQDFPGLGGLQVSGKKGKGKKKKAAPKGQWGGQKAESIKSQEGEYRTAKAKEAPAPQWGGTAYTPGW